MQDAAYPARLRDIFDPPVLLYGKGSLPLFDEEAAIAVVGARKPSPYGEKWAERFGLELAAGGALVVSDRYCFGSTPGREIIELKDDEEALPQICMHIMKHSECARYIADEKVQQRRETADHLAREYHADGIIYEQMKYCDYWGFERALVSYICLLYTSPSPRD